ncbi:hypothetical protein HGRIS_008708 [Hohenbuehelia grisea]|uniref:precorrin-2 dehydrogenase n=1 Tax=Hohenbuehelia grisea TaxID=104357 RepID=A0ABR3J904_9AGAR
MQNDQAYSTPVGGASLMLSFRLQSKTVLIIGSGQLAASRAFAALEADSDVVIIANGGVDAACEELRWRSKQGQLTLLDWNALPSSSQPSSDDRELDALEDYIISKRLYITVVVVTDTISGTRRRSRASAARIYQICRAHNLLVNVTDMPEFCDFSFTSTHRFEDQSANSPSALQVGVTTNGHGCRLAGRIRREIVSNLSKHIGASVMKVGHLRALAKSQATRATVTHPDRRTVDGAEIFDDEEICEDGVVTTPNRPVAQRKAAETAEESARRTMKWVAQVSEYWSYQQLSAMTSTDMDEILTGKPTPSASPEPSSTISADRNSQSHPETSQTTPHPPPFSVHDLALGPPPKRGRILLVGSGPGHPSLLTIATHTALTKMADLVLSDKLVPAPVLALIPSSTEVRIAKKFPGNADGAQNEMMEAAIEGARKGLCVVRLKQGDPAVYGRFGEEVLFFRAHGFEPIVIPGVSSAIAAPTFAGIPVTQRGVAESLMVCTGVGRAGKSVVLPGYERGRTLVVLMGVARLAQVVRTLTHTLSTPDPAAALRQNVEVPKEHGTRDGAAYPPHLPIAIIERASMADQRVIVSTLRDVVRAMDSVGEQRPPAMMVVGWSVLALWGSGDMTVLDVPGKGEIQQDEDERRIRRWLGPDAAIGWRIQEGLQDGWGEF